MSRNPIKLLLVMIVLSHLTGSSPARKLHDPHSRSLLDYYFLLPHQYLPFLPTDSRLVRENAIQIKDLDAGFLKSGESTEEVAATLALFKKADGSDLVAVENRSCLAGCSSSLSLLSYATNRWVDVTHDVLPTIDESQIQTLLQRQYFSGPGAANRRSQLIFSLRKSNQSIEVNEHWSGMAVGQFIWANDAFTFKSEEPAGGGSAVLASIDNTAGDRLQIVGVDPELPASLPLNGHLRVKIAYELKSAKYCFIWAKPGTMEERLPDDFTSGSMRYKPGSGVTTAYFGFNNQAHLDVLRVMMVDEHQKPILNLTYNIDANWTGTRNCPKFHVECFPDVGNFGVPLACMVYPSGLRPGQEPTYSWNVLNGVIATGQGTRRITVNPGDAETITAQLTIDKLDASCERKASFTMPVNALVQSKKAAN